MDRTLTLVICMAVLTWLTLMAASLFRAQAWTHRGMVIAVGNRDRMPEPTPLAGRVERTARNTVENFLLFAVIALVAHAAGATGSRVEPGAEVFFWARVAFIPIYYAGIIYLRTAAWLVGTIGLGMMISVLL